MKINDIKARLDATRHELRDVLVSGRTVDLSHPLIDADIRDPRINNDSWTRWATSLARQVAETSPLFHQDSSGRADIGETALFATQLKYFIAEFFGDYFPTVDVRNWLTFDTSLPVGAIDYSARRILKHGQFTAVASSGRDAPVITVGAAEDLYRNVEYQGKIIYTLAQLEHAAYSGFPLEREELNALALAAEQNVEQRFHIGDADHGTLGYYNGAAASGIPLYVAVTGTWATATHAQIMGDLRVLMYGIRNATGVTMLYPDSIAIPSSLYQYLGVLRANTVGTVRDSMLAEWPGLKIYESNIANLLDAAGTGPRLFAFASTNMASRFGMPRELEMLAPQQVGTTFESIGRQNCAGAILPQPLAMGHMDGC
jgi:hypothetical protein